MKAFCYTTVGVGSCGANNSGKDFTGIVLAANRESLFWVIDWSLNPYAVKFAELKERSLVEVSHAKIDAYGSPSGAKLEEMLGEIGLPENLDWHVFTNSKGRSKPFTPPIKG